jgi:hypothetical protein
MIQLDGSQRSQKGRKSDSISVDDSSNSVMIYENESLQMLSLDNPKSSRGVGSTGVRRTFTCNHDSRADSIILRQKRTEHESLIWRVGKLVGFPTARWGRSRDVFSRIPDRTKKMKNNPVLLSSALFIAQEQKESTIQSQRKTIAIHT